jgi:hypothetical protein
MFPWCAREAGARREGLRRASERSIDAVRSCAISHVCERCSGFRSHAPGTYPRRMHRRQSTNTTRTLCVRANTHPARERTTHGEGGGDARTGRERPLQQHAVMRAHVSCAPAAIPLILYAISSSRSFSFRASSEVWSASAFHASRSFECACNALLA